MTKLTNSKCVKTQKLKLWQLKSPNNDKFQIITKLKNSNCGKTQVLKLWRKNSNKSYWQNSICMKTQNLKLRQNSKSQILTTLKLWQISFYEGKKFKGSFSRKNLTPWQAMICTLGSILQSCNFFKVSFKFVDYHTNCWITVMVLFTWCC